MIYLKLLFAGFQRRGLEAIVAVLVLALANVFVTATMMVISGSRLSLHRAQEADRPEIIQVKGRFNRALFETPRSGNLPPVTLPVYDPLLNPDPLVAASAGGIVLMRQSLLRNTVADNGFLNLYVFGIEPDLERRVSRFHLKRGRFLEASDESAGVIDTASAGALGIDLGETVTVRKADGMDFRIMIVGILDQFEMRDAPPHTIDTPTLQQGASSVTSGILVTLRTSQLIFGRSTLTDALVIAPQPAAVPEIAEALRQAFRLEPGIFVRERFELFSRKVRDFTLTLGFFSGIAAVTAALTGLFVAKLLQDVYAERQQQLAILSALGFSFARTLLLVGCLGIGIAVIGAVAGVAGALLLGPKQFAMPSLMANLGIVEPRFDALAAITICGLSLIPTFLGLAPITWRLARSSVAEALVKPAA